MDPTLHHKMKVDEPMMDLVKNTDTRGGRTRAQKTTVFNVDREHRDGCKLSETSEWWTSLSTSHDERIMTAIAKQCKGKVQSNGKCNAEFCELASSKQSWR